MPILNADARMVCDHGGQVVVTPRQAVVLADGVPVLAEGDLVGAPIIGCTLVPTGVTSPCTNIVSELPLPGVGQSLVAMADGRPILLEGVQCVTDSVPPATAFVVFPGQVVALA